VVLTGSARGQTDFKVPVAGLARFDESPNGIMSAVAGGWVGPGDAIERRDSMKGDPKVIEFLNLALKNELTAVNQYFLHARMLSNWGVSELGAYEYKESIEEMHHADWLIERILFLDGLPNLQDLGKLRIGESVEEILHCDMALENDAIPLLRDAMAHAESVRDYGSRDLFGKILHNEEEHVDYIETQFALIERIGIQNYIQLQSKPNAKDHD
jgi:bacterioferritin